MKINFKKIFKSKEFWENAAYVIFAVLLFFGLRFTIGSYYINQTSMEPNYVPNERLLFNKLAYKFGAPQRGDIIYFHPPIPSTSPFIKRIIGLPGEQVVIKSGVVTIVEPDGSRFTLQEPYVKEPFTYSYTSAVIPPNEYFVLGDNRNISEDSHYGWFVSRNQIIGKAWLDIWPPGRWGLAPIYRQPASVVTTPGN
jgi:signal peptidase I